MSDDARDAALDLSADASPDERRRLGRALRKEVARSDHARCDAPSGRDPFALLAGQEETRLAWLVAERHRRRCESPFTFFRGASIVMAADLTTSPATGIEVQVCGDAHLQNFGMFASPERRLVFDLNDFDETTRGSWEWDVKRLAASCRIAAETRTFDDAVCDSITRASLRAYRDTMQDFADRGFLDGWYGEPNADQQEQLDRALQRPSTRKTVTQVTARARRHDHLQAFDKLVEDVDGVTRIRHDPPRIVPIRDVLPAHDGGRTSRACVRVQA